MARILLVKAGHLTPANPRVTFPLGIMSLASVLRNRGHEVVLADTRIGQDPVDTARRFNPQIVGISALTVEAYSLYRIAKEMKSLSKAPQVIAGGPHPTSFPEEVLADPNIDCLTLGEGEGTFPELVEALEAGQGLSAIKGVVFRENGTISFTEPRPHIQDLDSLPFPSWDLVDLPLYFQRDSMASVGLRPYMNIFTSRSCPYRCIYCHDIFGKGFRARGPENVIAEMEALISRYGIRDFEVLDDVFNLDSKRVHRILDLILRKGIKLHLSFPNGLRTDKLEEDLLEKLKNAGVNHLSIAVETASPRLQKLIRKNLNLEKVREAISQCSRLGIFTRGFFMLGFPTETEEEMRETIRFAVESDLHTALFFIVIPFKGTQLYEIYKEELKRRTIQKGGSERFTDYDYFDGTFNLSRVGDRTLFSLQRKAFRLFYLNPKRIYRIIRTFPGPLSHFLRYTYPVWWRFSRLP